MRFDPANDDLANLPSREFGLKRLRPRAAETELFDGRSFAPEMRQDLIGGMFETSWVLLRDDHGHFEKAGALHRLCYPAGNLCEIGDDRPKRFLHIDHCQRSALARE